MTMIKSCAGATPSSEPSPSRPYFVPVSIGQEGLFDGKKLAWRETGCKQSMLLRDNGLRITLSLLTKTDNITE